jgi:hypothetical protein
MVRTFESARRRLLPTPTPELDRAFTAYIDALLLLYGECPEEQARAIALHDRANDLGRPFEALVNRMLDEKQGMRTQR